MEEIIKKIQQEEPQMFTEAERYVINNIEMKYKTLRERKAWLTGFTMLLNELPDMNYTKRKSLLIWYILRKRNKFTEDKIKKIYEA